jgi:hypothetical protein
MARPSIPIIGHFNPFAEYPALVVPIYQDNLGRLFAIYRRSFQEIPETTRYVRHEQQTITKLSRFVPGRHRLFAFSPSRVVSFSGRREKEFLSALLDGNVLGPANPYFVLSMAIRTKDRPAVFKAVRCCIAEFGGQDEFVLDWYSRQRSLAESAGISLPVQFAEVYSTTDLLQIGCSLDKVPAFRRLCREFNWSDEYWQARRPLVTLLPQDPETMRTALTTHAVDAVVPETADLLDDSQTSESFAFASSRYVLAINPTSAVVSPFTSLNWHDVLNAASANEGFRWLKPRASTMAGRRIAHALMRQFGERELASLEQKVESYPESDSQRIARAIVNGQWQVDAFIAQEHSITSLLRDIPPNNRPIVVADQHPDLISDQQIALLRHVEAGKRPIFISFCNFLVDDLSRVEFEIAGMEGPVPTAALDENYAAAAREIERLERPLALCLVVDISSSMEGEKLEQAKIALGALLGRLSPERGDVVGLVAFSDNVEVLVPMGPLSANEGDLVRHIAGLQTRGRTALLDAVVTGWEELGAWPTMVRAAVVLSDGHENASNTSTDTALTILRSIRRSDRLCFGLAYGQDADLGLMRQLSFAAGGAAFRGRTENVRALFESIVRSL